MRSVRIAAVASALAVAPAILAAQTTCSTCSRVAVIGFGGTPTHENSSASVAAPARDSGGWHITVEPGILSPTLGGRAAIGNLLRSVQINLTARQLFAHPVLSGVLYVQATKGPWSIALDGTYVDRTQPVTSEYSFIGTVCTPLGGGAEACGAGPDSSRVTGSLHATQGILEGLVFRQISGSVEMMVGAIGSDARTRISATVPTFGSGSGGFATMLVEVKSRSEVWGDPVIGARWTPVDNDHWHLMLFGDAGGLSHRNWTWQVVPSVGYRLSTVVELALEYRALSTNYSTGSEKDTFKYNVTIVGPQLALAVHL